MAVRGEIIREPHGTYTFRTTCPLCGKPAEVTGLRKRALDRWDMGRGDFVQDAFPELSPAGREILLSGSHGPCFDVAFPEDDYDISPG